VQPRLRPRPPSNTGIDALAHPHPPRGAGPDNRPHVLGPLLDLTPGRRLREVPESSPLPACDEGLVREVVVERAEIDRPSVPAIDHGRFPQDQGYVQGRLSRVDAVPDDGLADAGGFARATETDPQVPVGEVDELSVEPPGRLEC